MDEVPHARRYAKACDACHKKKIRCVYTEPACELCQKTGRRCTFTRIEKAMPKRPRRGKYLAALEERMNNMELALQRSREGQEPKDSSSLDESPEEPKDTNSLAKSISRSPTLVSDELCGAIKLEFPPKDEALRMAQGYFASFNHTFPVFDRKNFMQRMQSDYPPRKGTDIVWRAAVCTVLCFAHRLRAMSNPQEGDAENLKACEFMKDALDLAPKLTYGLIYNRKPSVEQAQVLLGIATVFRGSPLPEAALMPVSAAIRMLQQMGVHKAEPMTEVDTAAAKERERALWVAYILDKDISLQHRTPPVIYDHDIGRKPPEHHESDGVGMIYSLDTQFEVNLFAASQRLAAIQTQVWNRILSPSAPKSLMALQAAQADLNPVLAAWRNSLPFSFKPEELVGRWPKHAIVQIVVLHFRYAHTLVELNKEPPFEKDDANPLNGNCPAAQSLPQYPHSTAIVAVEASRDALDLASLTPRGNFQNAWLFFNFSISAVLTLLVNGIVRPLDTQISRDLQRVDTWLRVIDILASAIEQPELLEKKEFLLHVRSWMLKVVEDSLKGGHRNDDLLQCLEQGPASFIDSTLGSSYDSLDDMQWLADLGNVHPDVFPLEMLQESDSWESWTGQHAGINGQAY